MSRSWDERQLVQAVGRLQRAARHASLARYRLDDDFEPWVRVLWALREAESALTDLRRFERRHRDSASGRDAESRQTIGGVS